MNWDALGAIAELAGATGVIITLVYLSIQLRQNTSASKMTAIQNSMENSARFSELLTMNQDVSELFWQGLANPDALNVRQKRTFVGILNTFVRRELVAFYLHEQGAMPNDLWESRVASFTGPLNQPGFKLYLATAGTTLPADFRRYIESLMKHESTLSDEMKALISNPDTYAPSESG